MKQIFILVFVTFLSILVVTPVYATEIDGSESSSDSDTTESSNTCKYLFEKKSVEKDEQGHIISGITHHEIAPTSTICDVTDCAISCSNGVYCYFIRQSSGYYMLMSVNGITTYSCARVRYYNGEVTSQVTDIGSVTVNGLTSSCWRDEDYFYTNIPIFNEGDTDSIENYINDGDYSGAENVDDVNEAEEDEYDESIPMPHNLKVVQGVDQTGATKQTKYLANYNKDVVISWEQSDKLDDMQYEVDVAFSAYRIPDDNFNEIREINTAYQQIVKSTTYSDSSSSITVKLDASQLNALKDKGYLSKLYIRVRNKVGHKSSNYARVTIDIQDKSAFVDETEIESEGPDTDDEQASDEYNGTNADAENGGANLDFSNISVDGILSFITSGFGLLGDYGIIALMSKCYLYLPGTVWTLIYFFISMMIVMSVIKLVKDLVF